MSSWMEDNTVAMLREGFQAPSGGMKRT
uniref:Uncharacterized protein n=1 Tax=Anguilla anguilla TaxID=7936 RepID=A0A0E9RT09_ANGAN